MFKNNHREPNKVTLVGWVDRAFNQSLSKQNIKARFKTTRIWRLNPRAMDNRSKLEELYTSKSNLDISNDVDGSQWGKDRIATKLINIVIISQNESESTRDDYVQSTT